MIVQMELWQLITLLLAFFACVGAFGKALLAVTERNNRERFFSLEEKLNGVTKSMERIADIERDLMRLRAELPERYVLRGDYIRGQTTIESKIDALAMKLENLQLRSGAPNVR